MILSPCTPVPPALLPILMGSFPGPFTWVQCPHSYSPPTVLCIRGPRRKPSCLQFRRSLRARPHFQTHPGTDCEQSCWHRDPPGHTHVCTSEILKFHCIWLLPLQCWSGSSPAHRGAPWETISSVPPEPGHGPTLAMESETAMGLHSMSS